MDKRRVWFYRGDGVKLWGLYNYWNRTAAWYGGFITVRTPWFAMMIFRERTTKYG